MKIYVASSKSLYETEEYEIMRTWLQQKYANDELIFAKDLYKSNNDWFVKWPKLCKKIDMLLFLSHNGYIGKGAYTEIQDTLNKGKPVYYVSKTYQFYELCISPYRDACAELIINEDNWKQYAFVKIGRSA